MPKACQRTPPAENSQCTAIKVAEAASVGAKRGGAGDGAAYQRAQHDAEDHVKGCRPAHEALLAHANDQHHSAINHDRTQGHLRHVDVN